jgi:hypothetical protein
MAQARTAQLLANKDNYQSRNYTARQNIFSMGYHQKQQKAQNDNRRVALTWTQERKRRRGLLSLLLLSFIYLLLPNWFRV